MTHQEIADSCQALFEQRNLEVREARRRFLPLIEAMQRECGEVGHIYRVHQLGFELSRRCAICDLPEKAA